MTPEVLSNFLVQWGTIAFSVYTGIVAISSIAVKVLVSYTKGMQENVPEYKPSLGFFRVLAFLEALALNSPTATALLKTSPLAKPAVVVPKKDI